MDSERATGSTHSVRFAVAALVVLCLLAVTFVLRSNWGRGMPVEVVRSGEDTVGEPALAEAHRRDVGVRTLVPADRHAGRGEAILRVVDTRGVALEHVGVWDGQDDAEWLTKTSRHFLGETDDDGFVTVPDPDSGRAVLVGRPTYLTQRIDVAPGGSYDVTLAAGGMLRFRCTYGANGEPAAGMDVVVAGSGSSVFPLRDEWPTPPEGAVPTHPMERPVFHARSGSDGWVTMRGLPPGKLMWCAWGVDCVLSGGPGLKPPDTTAVMAQDTQYDLEFTRLWACGYRLVGDVEVTSKAVPLPRSGMNSSPLGDMVRWSVERKLRDQHPGALVFVLPAEGEHTLSVSLVLKQHGRHDFELPFVSLAEFARRGVTVVDASTIRAEGTVSELVVLRVLNPGGSELTGVRGKVWAEDERMILSVLSGEGTLVPPGRYRFLPEQEIVRNCLSGKGEFSVAGATRDASRYVNVDLELTHTLRPVTLVAPEGLAQCEVVDVDGVRDRGTVVNLGGGGDPMSVFLVEGRRWEFRGGRERSVLGRADLRRPDDVPLQVNLEAPRR